eukprot:689319-Karenia_brevis.AAC.1
MREVPLAEARAEYGNKLVMAAIGALEKDDSSFRIIHDATHGVKVNPRIRQRDQVRYPAVAEKAKILGKAAIRKMTHFGLKADVSKAHRRVRVRRRDHGYQACQLEDGKVWLNEVGTFGVGSAGYWWSRLGGAAGRVILSVMLREEVWTLLYADDFDFVAAGGCAMEDLALIFLLLVLMK